MTTALLVAVLLLTALTLFNLVVVLGVVRRLRAHETRLGNLVEPPPVTTVTLGERIGDFTATVGDRVVDRASLRGRTLVGFFSPDCPACHERLGDFRATAARHPGDVLAVVVRDGGDVDPVLAALDGTDAVVEDPDGPVARAFGVRGFPAFVLVRDDGVVESTGYLVPAPA